MISLIGCPMAYYGLFTIHKLVRGYLMFWVVVNLVRDRKDVEAVVYGVMAAVILQTLIVLFDKYVTKKVVNRSVGAFPHPNSLAMYIDLIIPMILAILLAGEFPKKQNQMGCDCNNGGPAVYSFYKVKGGPHNSWSRSRRGDFLFHYP